MLPHNQHRGNTPTLYANEHVHKSPYKTIENVSIPFIAFE